MLITKRKLNVVAGCNKSPLIKSNVKESIIVELGNNNNNNCNKCIKEHRTTSTTNKHVTNYSSNYNINIENRASLKTFSRDIKFVHVFQISSQLTPTIHTFT